MTTTIDWSARIEYSGPATADAEHVADELLTRSDGDAVSFRQGSVALSLTVAGAHDYNGAIDFIVMRAADLSPDQWEIAGVEVRRSDLVDADLERPMLPALVGISESAEILGVTRQRAHAIAKSSGFPPPIAELAAGPVYLEHAVRAFAAQPRPAGRPKGAIDVGTFPNVVRVSGVGAAGSVVLQGSKPKRTRRQAS